MFLIGRRIGRYYLQSLIEQGGMGDIYLATDIRLHRRVAIKVMSTLISEQADTVMMNEAVNLFKREARAVTMLDHPHILPLFDYGEETIDGMLLTYIVMPYRPEGSLAGWVSKRRRLGNLTLYEAAHFLQQAARALQYAHDHNIIHRDVKPSNFLIVTNKQHPGRPDIQLADFGVAKFMRAISTPTGIIRGTPSYMAPEFWRGAVVPASDQYALALMIYEMITGTLPFQGDGPEQLFYQHMYVEPPLASSLNSSVPPEIDAVLMRALAKNPAKRYDSVAAFAKAFRQALFQQGAVIPTPLEKTQEAGPSMSRHRVEPTQEVDDDMQDMSPPIAPHISRGHRKRNIFITVMAFVLITSGLGFVLFSSFQQFNGTKQIVINTRFQSETALERNQTSQTAFANATRTASDATSTAVGADSTANAVATATSVSAKETAVSAAATAGAEATATAVVFATTTAYNGIIHVGPMKLNNTMQSNNLVENWDIVDPSTGAGCTFMQGSYHAGELTNGNFSACFEHGVDLADFSYQVDMRILKGNGGGIAFRANPDTGTFYYFYLDTHGNYVLELVNADTLSQSPLAQGFSPAIATEFNVPNLIAVVAKGSSIQVYVNMQPVAQASDSSVAHGNLGVVAQDVNASTDVSFSNAQAWQRC